MTFTNNGAGYESENVYESDRQQVVGIGYNRTTGEPIKALEPMFLIIKSDDKFQLKQTIFGGRKIHIKSFKTLEAAIKYANSIN